ncbi:MAG: hydroxymethylglutaryl-CoA synthase, partial [Patulibacter sp.]
MTEVGIRGYAAYVPRNVLATTAFGAEPPVADRGGRAVASHDEDSVTLAVEAAGRLEASADGPLLLATSEPPYLDKSSAATVHAALELPTDRAALDLGGLRSGAVALSTALATGGTAVLADVRTPAPGAPDELAHGDGAAAFACGDGPGVATVIGRAAATHELLDRWRIPGDRHPTAWDERFTAEDLVPLLTETAAKALAEAGIERADHVVVACANRRASGPARKVLGSDGSDAQIEAMTGNLGAAQIGVLLADALDRSTPGQTILAVAAADGADAVVLRVDADPAAHRGGPSVREQLADRRSITYDRFLRWRGILEI